MTNLVRGDPESFRVFRKISAPRRAALTGRPFTRLKSTGPHRVSAAAGRKTTESSMRIR